jgi:phage gp36-like protein
MAYTTISNLINTVSQRVLIELSNDTDEPTTVNETVVNAVIEEQSAIIDGYATMRFNTPITNVSLLLALRNVCNTLTVMALFQRRRELTEIEQEQRALALQTLIDLSNGKIFANLDRDGNITDVTGFFSWSNTRKVYPTAQNFNERTV